MSEPSWKEKNHEAESPSYDHGEMPAPILYRVEGTIQNHLDVAQEDAFSCLLYHHFVSSIVLTIEIHWHPFVVLKSNQP